MKWLIVRLILLFEKEMFCFYLKQALYFVLVKTKRQIYATKIVLK
jgi:hypothetical protein